MKTVTHIDAGRNFLQLLDEVEKGETIGITSDGRLVATLSPGPEVQTADAEAAKRDLIDRLRSQPPINVPRGTRDELYDD